MLKSNTNELNEPTALTDRTQPATINMWVLCSSKVVVARFLRVEKIDFRVEIVKNLKTVSLEELRVEGMPETREQTTNSLSN